MSATTSQLIADHLGCLLPTSRIVDLSWEACLPQLKPVLMTPDAHMSDTSVMREYSERVDKQIAGRKGLARCVGKDWIVHRYIQQMPGRAVNYGFHDTKAPYISHSGLHMWQTVGTRHDYAHSDYSQVLTLVRSDMLVDGQSMRTVDVMRHADFGWLVSDDGAMGITRYPVGDVKDMTDATKEVPRLVTPIGEFELAAILRDGHTAALGVAPSNNRLGVGWAQIALETGRGKSINNCNLGNVTAGKSWLGEYFAMKVPPPDPPVLKFRSYPHWLDSAADYWRLLDARFKVALAHFDAGHPDKAAEQLGLARYFLAPIAQYSKGMTSLFSEFNSKILPKL